MCKIFEVLKGLGEVPLVYSYFFETGVAPAGRMGSELSCESVAQ